MLLTKTLMVKPGRYVAYYENLGYIIPKHKVGSHKKLMVSRKTTIEVKVDHLLKTSANKIEYCCDNCKNIFTTSYNNYLKANKTKGDFCRKCSLKVYNSGANNFNYGKKLKHGFKSGKENYAYINFRGENNPNYNPNLTDEDRLDNRDTLENITWRKEIYKRDLYRCQICHNSHNLEAHHLDGYTEFKDKRFSIDNGITLCKKCHKSYHLAYGYKNSTKEKYNQYIQEISCVYFN